MSDNPPVPHMSGAYWRIGSIITTFDPMPAPDAGIFDAPTVYVCCNSEWWSLILERVRVLTRLDAWAGDADEKFRVTQEIERFLAAVNCEDCSEFITDMRVSPNGKLQKKVGGAWQDADGDGGDTTVYNSQSTYVSEMYPPDQVDNGLSAQERACNIASGLSEWMYSKFNDILDEIDASADTIQAIDGVLRLFPPAYLISETLGNAVFTIVEATTSVLRALFDTDEKENLLCGIYCYLEPVGVLDDTNVEGLKNIIEVALTNSILQASFNTIFVAGLDNAALIHRAMLYQSVGGSVDCPTLCVDCFGSGCTTFESDNPVWEITLGSLLAEGCDGGEGVENGGSGEIEIWLTLPASATFSSVKFNSHNGSGTTHSIVEVYEDTTLVATLLDFSGGGGATCNHNNIGTGFAIGNRVRFYEICAAYTEWSKLEVCWD